MRKKKVKGGVAKSLFKNYFIGYIVLIIVMVLLVSCTLLIEMVWLFYKSEEQYTNINYKLSNDYNLITEEELKEVNGFLLVVDKDNNIINKRGNVIKEFEEITLNDYLILFSGGSQFKEISEVKNYIIKGVESIIAISDTDNATIISSEAGVEYSIYYKYMDESNSLVVFGLPYENINKYGNYNAEKGNSIGIFRIIIFNLVVLLLLLYIFAKLTAKKFTMPIRKLNKGMKLITEGNYGEQVRLKVGNEFEELADGFNLMSTAIKNEKDENARLQQERNELILHISHDLKNPLAAILGYSEIITGENSLSDEERREYLNIISKNSKRANKIITDLFEFSLLESTDYKLNLNKLDLNEVLREILADYIPEIEAKQFKYDFNISEEKYFIEIDEVKFTRAISNLIDNSIKYNEKDTTIYVSSTICKDKVEIMIKDNGRGIDKEIREKIFEAFVREDKSRNSTTGGTGLGLAITKAIVEKHNGNILLLDSDIGTEYIITFIIK